MQLLNTVNLSGTYNMLDDIDTSGDWQNKLMTELTKLGIDGFIEHIDIGAIFHQHNRQPVMSFYYSHALDQDGWDFMKTAVGAMVAEDTELHDGFTSWSSQDAVEHILEHRFFEFWEKNNSGVASPMEITKLILTLWHVLKYCQESEYFNYEVPADGLVINGVNLGDPYSDDGVDFAINVIEMVQTLTDNDNTTSGKENKGKSNPKRKKRAKHNRKK